MNVIGYSDADWGGCAFSKKSVSNYCVFLGTSLVSWKTKKQKTTSKSFAESEYRCMSVATSDLVWIVGLLQDLQVLITYPVI